jgi:hypothetical protein
MVCQSRPINNSNENSPPHFRNNNVVTLKAAVGAKNHFSLRQTTFVCINYKNFKNKTQKGAAARLARLNELRCCLRDKIILYEMRQRRCCL